MVPLMKQNKQSRPSDQGFSLVELLVALVFMSLLMAGMAKVFQSSVKSFATTNETMGAQRTNRWALDQISDDFSQAGLVFPDRAMPSFVISAAESLFSITPGVAVAGVTRVSDSDPTSTQTEAVTADVVQFFMDVPLAVTGTWGASTSGNSPNPGGT